MTCKACQGEWPIADHRLGDCGVTQAYLFDDQYFEGWTVLVLKQHATELFQLSTTDRGRLIEEVSAVAKALSTVYQANKINYELLGNQLPHIHWHLIPRGARDPAPNEPVWRVRHVPVSLGRDALVSQLELLRGELHRTLPGFVTDTMSDGVERRSRLE